MLRSACTRRLTCAIPFVPAVGVLLFLFWRILARGEVFGLGDHSAYYWPVRSLFVALVANSHGVPLWNPFLSSGQPFAANPHQAVFHPVTALFLALPFEWAYRLQVLVPVVLLTLSGYFLARSLGLGRAVAACSAVAWGAGGATASLLQVLPGLLTLAPLPALLAFAIRLGRRRRAADVLAFGLVFGLMVLGGDPPGLLFAALLSSVGVLHGTLLAPRGTAVSPAVALSRLALGGLLGALVGAVSLVPSITHGLKTVRATGLDERNAYAFTTPVERLAELAAPGVMNVRARDDRGVLLGERLYPGRGRPFLSSIYPGLLLVIGAAAAWTERRSPSRLWLLPAAIGVVFSLGAATPVFPAARLLPVLSGIRFPERYLLLTLVAITVAGTCGLGRLIEGDRRRLPAAAIGGALALLASGALARGSVGDGAVLTAVFLRQSVLLGLGIGAIAFAARSPRGALVRLLPAVLLAAELGFAGRPSVGPVPPGELRAVPAALAPLLRAPVPGYVFHAAASDPERGLLPGIYGPPSLAQFAIPTALDRDFDLAELSWSGRATATVLRTISAHPAVADTVLARRGIAAVVAFRSDVPRSRTAASARRREDLLALFAVPGPRPFAFAADRLVAARGEDGWAAAVVAAGRAATGLAVVDPADAPWPLPAVLSPATVRVATRAPARIVLNVDSAGPGPSFVAVNQTWDTGWRARCDGQSLPLVRTDLSLSGVLVPGGRHRVVLTYRSLPVAFGAGITLVALVAATILLVRLRRVPS